MATIYRTNNAPSVTQISTITFSSIVSTNTYSIVINGKAVSYVALSSTAATLYAALMNAWNSSPEPEHQELIASGGVSNVVLTARSAGVPSSVTATATTGTATVTATQAASGPKFWSGTANWSAAPATGDTLVLENLSGDILYGLTDTNDYAVVKFASTFTGKVGLAPISDSGYSEYRTQNLTLGTGADPIQIEIGEGSGSQSQRLNLDLVGAAATIIVYGTGRSTNDYPVLIANPGSTSTLSQYSGSVKLTSSSSATLASVNVVSSSGSSSSLYIGSAITTTLANLYGVTASLWGPITTLNAFDSTNATVNGSAAIATINAGSRGVIDWRSTGGITTRVNVAADGTLDATKAVSGFTVTNASCFARGTIKDPMSRATWTNGIKLEGARISEVSLELGFAKTIEVS